MGRKQIEHLNERYKRVNGERGPLSWLCVYCGLPADTLDHVPPLSRVDDYSALGVAKEQYITIPACQQCNSIASDSLQSTFLERVEYVKDRLSIKYRRFLKDIDWDEEELAELGPNLRSKVLENVKKGEIVRARIEYYAGVDYVLDNIDPG